MTQLPRSRAYRPPLWHSRAYRHIQRSYGTDTLLVIAHRRREVPKLRDAMAEIVRDLRYLDRLMRLHGMGVTE